ncbi:MAG: FAD-binding oxidoreductase [Chloroflexi bacterium]|nr:FAD-binding oxidoreductase [Chloroflexota bacterium]
MSHGPITDATDTLRARLTGRVVTPGDPDYDTLRTIVYGGVDRRPALIARVADVADVRTVIATARRTGLPLAVRCGGHSAAGHSSVAGGIVLDVRELRMLDIDVRARTAWAGTGLTAGELTAATAEHGLVVGFGDTASVGIGGITLGGGVGYLVRRFGLTIDDLLAAEVVTADGEVLMTDADHHPDLFWAIRGGGGNFGVATRFRYRLHPLPVVTGGMLLLPATAATIEGFMAAAAAAPDEVSTIANVMSCPPMPFVPAELHDRPVILAMICAAAPEAVATDMLAPFRALAVPITDMLAEMPVTGMYPPEDPDYHPLAVARTMFLDHVDRALGQRIVDAIEASDAPMRVVQLRALGGAMARVAVDATAFAHRDSEVMANVASFYVGEDDRPRRQAWVDELAAALHQTDDGAYVNFLTDDGPARIRQAYPGATFDRLVELKRRYDPTNLFRSTEVIPTGV